MSYELYDRSSKKDDTEDSDQQNNSEDDTEKESNEEKTENVNLQQMEAREEAKLKSKYPQAMRPGGSAFLQKRLHKGNKYFDSGDYNMAKAKGANKARMQQILQEPTGDAIPTPDNLPTRKVSLVQSKLAAGLS